MDFMNNSVSEINQVVEGTGNPTGRRTQFLRVLASEIRESRIPLDQQILIVGGSAEDEQTLREAGFKRIVNSNLPTDMDRLVED
jgi:hypothetical protein